ncbi:aminotransferase class III-fold pyridoxal phosphate-dependent enzyme [Streptomyces caatingaensis]|uniref:aminotransferase class III-fold pyridoxal phosphate-dependent enzyme n=1 Tax=Streptomyces caatingaensis TaxID=1678637 RepID=UPI00069D3B30|nr:aminotransferase class III-fold pyridoxal phosphate-dependent enzyme [Streptomyces caatingaensis]
MASTQPPAALPATRGGPRRARTARTHARALPIVPVRARGLTIEGADGRRYLDCFPGAGSLVLGHNHPVVLEAVRSVPDSCALPDSGVPGPLHDAFLAELRATLPEPLARRARVRFCAPSRAAALAAALGPVPGAEAVAAVHDEDGVLVTGAERLRSARDEAAARSVPLVADETRTGPARTGRFWGIEHGGVVPDVMALSGAVGGGLPLALVVHGDGLPAGPPEPFRGNRLALAAGGATLRHLRENHLADRARSLGARLLSRLRRDVLAHEAVREVRGLGLVLGVEFADAGTAAAVRHACLRRGLIVGPCDARPAVLRLLPPLTITDEQAEAVLDRLCDAIAAVPLPGPPTARTRKTAGTKTVSTRKEAGAAPA